MRLHDDIDFTTLNWVKQELDLTLKQARQALEAYVEDPSDTSQMRFCATYLHQVQGTLRMVELSGAARVVDEMEKLTLALLEGGVGDTDEAYEMLMRGIVQLPDYLERLQSGHRDIPVVLLPLLNELRRVRGAQPLAETALFAPDLDVSLPASAAGPDEPLPDRALRVAAAKIRKAFEAGLLHWFRNDAGPEVVGYLQGLCDRLCKITHETEARRSFWIAGGVLDGVARGALEPERALKVQVGKLDREIKEMALYGEQYFSANPPLELSNALLYYAAHAGTGSERIDELKQVFDLERLVPDADELDHARGAMAGHNRELLSTVSGAIKEDLLRVKDALDLKVRQGDRSIEGFVELCETLERVAETLGVLGLSAPRKVVLEKREQIERLIEDQSEASESSLLEIAGSLLYVESSLDDYIDQLGAAAEAEPAAAIEPGIEALPELPASEVRRILDALMKEASSNLQSIKQSIVEFIEAPWDHDRVRDNPRLLEEIVGALKMLDLDEAAMLLEGIIAYNEVELLHKRAVPAAEELDTFADALASLEYYLEAVREHRSGRDKILEVARRSLSKLGYLGEDAVEARRRARDEAATRAEAETEAETEAGPETEAVAEPEPEAETVDPNKTVEIKALDEALLEEAAGEEAAGDAAEPTPAVEPGPADIADDIDEEIREVFIEEVEEELANLQELQPKWKADPEDEQTLTTIRRTFHTLKGSGRLVGALTIGEFSWQIENMLNRVLDGTIEASPAVVDLMDHAVAALPELLANVKGEGRPRVDFGAIERVAERLAGGEQAWLEAPTAAEPVEEAEAAEAEPAAAEEPPAEELATEEVDLDEFEFGEIEPEDTLPGLAEPESEVDLDEIEVADWEAEEDAAIGFEPEETAADIEPEEPTVETAEAEVEPEELGEPSESESADEVDEFEIGFPASEAADEPADDLESALAELDEFAVDEPELEAATGSDEVDTEVFETPILPEDSADAAEAGEERATTDDTVDELIAAAAIELETDEAAEAMESQGREPEYDLESFLDDMALDEALDEVEEAGAFPELDEIEEELVAAESEPSEPAEPVGAQPELAIDPVLLDILRTEVAGHVAVIEDYLAGATGGIPGVVTEELLRAVHTLNGAIAMVDLPALAAVTGPLEGYVKRLRLGELAPTEAGVGALEDSVSVVRAVVAGLDDPDAASVDTAELSLRLAGLRDELPQPASLQGLFPVAEEEATAEEAAADQDEVDLGADVEPFELDEGEATEEAATLEPGEASAEAVAEAEPGPEESAPEAVEETPEPEIAEAAEETTEDAVEEAPEESPVEEVAEAAASEQEAEVEPAESKEDVVAEEPEPADRIAGETITALASDLEAWEQSAEEFSEVVVPDEDTVALADLGELDDDLLEIFLQEGAEILDESDHKMAHWREAPEDKDAVVELQRELHTLKGGARMTGLAPIGDLSHAMESLFEGVVEDRVEVTTRTIEILEYGFDRLHQMLARVRAREPMTTGRGAIMQIEALLTGTIPEIPEVTDGKAVIEPDEEAPPAPPAAAAPVAPSPAAPPEDVRPTALDQQELRGAPAARPQQELIRVRADLLDNLVNYAGEVSIYRSRLEQQIGTFRFNLVEFDQTVQRLRDQLRKLEMETEAQILSRYQREAEELQESFDPLELDRFSTLQQLSRALAESVSDLVSIQGMLDDLTRQSETLLLQQSRVNSDLQEGLMRTRMVPFDSLVPRLRRILRQTSQELGKRASLRVEGAQGEMDRTVLERITAPLEHMLRNAIAHGLEAPEQRERAGKPAEGTIRMSIAREATEVVIAVADDGAGIDHDRVRAKAIERGLLKADAELTDRDLYGFILETGFSTADEVTKVAGRGVGMDVVNNEIKQLGGSLDISSTPGAGTTFVIRLPFTLAVTHAIMVRLGDATFAVPLSSIQGVVRMSRREFDRRMEAGETTYDFTGEEYQLQELSVLLGVERRDHGEDEMIPVLMSRIGDQRAAIRVDQVMGSREVVVKSVGPQISSVPGIFGATILGDGSVVMILDLGPLIRRGAALRLGTAEAAPAEAVAEVVPVKAARLPLIMVVDDSITMRKVTTRVLQRHEMDVVTAKDGVDALEQLQDRLPDLMLLDIEMPRMDGYELATHMRNDARLKDVPIIMVTSRSGAKHRERALEIGVNRYLGKPYQEADLLSNVRELLEETVGVD